MSPATSWARVALYTGDPAGLARARRSAARLGQAQESPASQRLGAWLMALVGDVAGLVRYVREYAATSA